MPNKVFVLGAGSTRYGRLNEGIIEIAMNASTDMAPVIMSNLGIPEVPGLSIESACGSGSIMFREAFANVASLE
jgi:acetyl-CoA C-acetyltransferase